MQMPIRSLQSMLRLLQRHAGKPTTVVPDGIFGPETARAVREFQQQNGLPVTGAADLTTWNAVVDAAREAHIHHGPRQGGLLALVRGVVEQRGLHLIDGHQVRQRYVHATDGKPRRYAGAVDFQHGVGQRVRGVGGLGQLRRPARAGGRGAERPTLLPRLVGEVAGRIPHVHAYHLGA